MKDFSVTLEDLQANRTGKLSPGQRAELQSKWRNGWIEIGVILVLILFVLYLGLTLLQSRIERPYGQLRNVGIGLIVLFPVLIYVRLNHMKVGSDLRVGTVKASQGTLQLSKGKSRFGTTEYWVRVSATPFKISEQLFVNLSELKRTSPACILYYAPLSLTFVAFEPMPQK